MGEDEKFDKLLLTPEAVKTYCRQKSQKQCVEYVNQLVSGRSPLFRPKGRERQELTKKGSDATEDRKSVV